MTLSTNFHSTTNVVDRLAAFNNSAQSRYIAVYIPFGDGRFSFGDSEFYTMEGFYKDFKTTAKDYRLDPDAFSADITDLSAIFEFNSKHAYVKFMDAMFGKNVPRDNLVVQIAGKSLEWHQVAGQHLSYLNRAHRQTAEATEKMATWNYVPTFGKQLVNYVFHDLGMMRNFCEQVQSGSFDQDELVLKAASQAAAAKKLS